MMCLFIFLENSFEINMERLSLVIKYDEHFRHVLALLDTTVERGMCKIYVFISIFVKKKSVFFFLTNVNITDYKAKIMALGVLSVQFKDHRTDNDIMKNKLQEMRTECERLMHNLKSSNRLLDEANKEKMHAEVERDNLVKYLKRNIANWFLIESLIILGSETRELL